MANVRRKKKTLFSTFDGLKKDSIARGSRKSADWLKNKINKGQFDKKFIVKRPKIGMMYTYAYDAKHKDTLPYWDRNPLMICIGYYPNGWLGLNLHYLAPRERIMLLDRLMEFEVGNGEKKRLELSYELLKGLGRLKMFRPTLKRYLVSHVSSKIVWIPSDEWEDMVLLPTARFMKASNTDVYKKSRAMYR